jgi:urease accessory protein
MLCEKIAGTVADFPGKKVDYVPIEWHETRKRIHRKTSSGGADIAIRLDDEILTRGIRQDDVFGVEGDTVYAADIPAFEVLVMTVEAGHAEARDKLCWEIGNKHAPLFWGDREGEFITPWDDPIEKLVRAIHGVGVEKRMGKPDFSRAISGPALHGHHHGAAHEH